MPRAAPTMAELPALSPEDAALAAQYPDFLPRPHAAHLSEEALTARNVRALLKRTYPGIKFSVTCDSGTLSASVTIGWDAFPDAPEGQAVRALTRIFKAGEFNGADDSYHYNQDTDRKAFARLFGNVEYVSTSRQRVTPAMIVEREVLVLRKEMARVKPQKATDEPVTARERARL